MNLEKLFAHSEQLVRTRLVLMLSYYIDLIHCDDRAGFVNTLAFLFKGLAMESTEKAFALQCADAIKVYLEGNSFLGKFPGVVNDLLPFTFTLIEKSNQIFPILQTMIMKHKLELGGASHLIEQLLKRVNIECQVHSKKSSMSILQSLRIISEFAKNRETAVWLEPYLKEICYYLTILNSIEFEDDIMEILHHYMTSTKKSFTLFKDILKYLPQIYKKSNRHISFNLFALINCGFEYAQEVLEENIEPMVTFILEIMATKHNDEDTGRLQGSLLIQLFMQMPWGHKIDSFIPLILQNTLQLLKTESDSITKQGLVNNILIAIYGYTDIALPILEKRKTLEEVLTIISKAQILKESYDIKVYVLGVTCILSRISSSVIDKLGPELFASMIKVLVANYKEELRKTESLEGSESEDSCDVRIVIKSRMMT